MKQVRFMEPDRATEKIKLWTIDNFVTVNECDQLVREAREKGFVGSAVQNSKDTSKMNMKTMARNSETAFIKRSDTTDLFGSRARDALRSLGVKDVDSYNLEGLQVQKYEKDQKYNPHYDTFADKDGSEQRSWTIMVYLNEQDSTNNLEGGCTYFPNIDFRTCPKKGRAIVWDNLTDDFCRDLNTLHTGEQVHKGNKIIVTMWFRKPDSPDHLCKNPNFHNPGPNGKFEGTEANSSGEIIEGFSNTMTICGIIFIVALVILVLFLIYYYYFLIKH